MSTSMVVTCNPQVTAVSQDRPGPGEEREDGTDGFQIPMTQTNAIKESPRELGERTKEFALSVRRFVLGMKKTLRTMEDCRQVVRSSGAVGANYIEANESLGKKDFLFRLRIARKEAKESAYWLELIGKNTTVEAQKLARELYDEAKELVNIFSAIINKSS